MPNPQRLTRAEMIRIIESGQSVMLPGGVIASTLAQIPDDATLAIGDPAKEQAALADLDREIERLQAQRANLVRQSVAVPAAAAVPTAPSAEPGLEPQDDPRAADRQSLLRGPDHAEPARPHGPAEKPKAK